MAKKTPKWLLGCGIGCGVLIFLAIGLGGVGVFYYGELTDRFDHAIEMRGELAEQHGGQEDYTPPPDGAPTPERVEAFLEVRESLRDYCQRWEDTVGHFDRLDQQEEISSGDLFKVFTSAWGLAPLLAEYFEARNQALLEAGMGLGEYTYLFVLAYHSMPAAEAPDVEPYVLKRRIRGVLLEMLRRQEAAGTADPDNARLLEEEIAALEEHPRRVPWQDGPPPSITDAFAPYRARLQELACPEAREFELSRNERKGISLHNN